MKTISAVIISYNEEEHVEGLMKSLTWVDEVIVVDSSSSDETSHRFSSLGAVVKNRAFDDFSNQRNFALQQATCDWVLIIDCDERVTDALAKEIRLLMEQDFPPNACRIRIHNFLNNRRVKYSGWEEDRHVRLFQRGMGKYSEARIHEHLQVPKPHELLNSPIEHYTAISWTKMKRYAKLQAQEILLSGKSSWYIWQLIWRPILRFAETYFYRNGFLDGRNGLLIALKDSGEVALKLIYFFEMSIKKNPKNL